MENQATDKDKLQKVVSLCKRRGFIFQSSEIYGGLRSAYDFGPLGTELKRNIAQQWWSAMVHEREDIVGLDASIVMHSKVWQASGHLATFSDPLVDCRNCKERFRADKAPKAHAGNAITYLDHTSPKKEKKTSVVGAVGYVCPVCGGSDLSEERQFNLMFRSNLGPVDPIDMMIEQFKKLPADASKTQLRGVIEEALKASTVYLRPETAQAMFVQFLNVQQSMSMKVPFGIAQTGKSFRNEITVEHFIFRSCEFEQMEMEFFVEPGTQIEWHKYWCDQRMQWWQALANSGSDFRFYETPKQDLAHYADAGFDIQYRFPWGWDELEGVASRTDYDLSQHIKESGVKLSYFDQQKNDPATGKPGWRYVPYVVEPAAGLTRGVLTFLLDAYREEEGVDAEGQVKSRVYLKLNPKLAPYKAAILPLVKKDGLPEISDKLSKELRSIGIYSKYDEQQSIGKRYAKHDEIGTPYCVTIDYESLTDHSATVRDRDSTKQERVALDQIPEYLRKGLAK